MDTGVPKPASRPLRDLIIVRVLLAAVVFVIALFFTVIARDWLPRAPLGFMYAAVACATALGGLWLGVTAMATALILAEWLIFEPKATMELTAQVLVRDGVFLAVSLALCLLLDQLRQARRRADLRQHESVRLADELRQRAAELEKRVTEAEALSEEVARINRQLGAQTAAAQRAATRAERLHQFTTLLLDQTGEAAVAGAIVEEGRRALDAAAAVVSRTNESGAVEVLASGGDAHIFGDPKSVCQPDSAVYDAVRRGDAVWIRDRTALARAYPRFGSASAGPHHAWCALPLSVEQRRVGCLMLAFDHAVDFSAEERSSMLLLAQQCVQGLDRARNYDQQRRARVRAEFAERRLAFLADASQRLASSLDLLNSLANLAEFAVPEFADGCIIHLTAEQDAPVVVAAAHEDPEQLERWRELQRRYPPSPLDEHGAGSVLRTGESYHSAAMTDDVLRAVACDDEHLQLLRALDVRELLAIPIAADGGTAGVITFVLSASSRSFDEADMTLADELGRRAGQALQNARLYQAAQHASEAKSNFLAIISHELRTPLNAIIGYSDLLLMGVPHEIPERALHQVERIRISARALLHLVEEVLSFSRIEAGKEELRISPVNLKALISDCLALVEPMALHKQLEVRVAMPEEPIKIVSDERKIRQIVTNLLSNAVKFTEQGMVSVKLRQRGDEVQVIVADTGIGISRKHLERIFDPFWQVEPATTRRFGGTGLGLGVARKLARLLEGRLDVRSVEGKGSTFVLALPVRVQQITRTTA